MTTTNGTALPPPEDLRWLTVLALPQRALGCLRRCWRAG